MKYYKITRIKNTILSFTVFILIFSSLVKAQSIQTDVPALKDVFANDFKIGCLLSYAHVGFATDPYVPGQSNVVDENGGYLIKYHMNSMSPGNWMKSTYIVNIPNNSAAYDAATTQAEKDSIDVNPIVVFNGNITAQLNWAQRQGFTFRGHTLIWHNQNPGTAFFREGYKTDGARLTKEKMLQRMENFIKEVIRIIHEGWPGLLTAMDVVNEAVNDDGTDRTSSNEYYTTIGDNSYIMKAFEYARKYTEEYGETQIKLYYNDYNTHVSSKADGIVRVCTPIFQAGYLDGIGMQDHDQYNSPSAAQWIASYDKFYPICTEMTVTEFDVKPSSTTLSSSVLTSQANQYGALVKCFIDRSYLSGRGKIVSLCKDGLNDQWCFVSNSSLWDAQNQCKPAFYEVVNVGLNYYSLDSLITYAQTLTQDEYSENSWTEFTTALSNAQNAMGENYSYSVSTSDALNEAKDSLNSAIENLTTAGTDIDENNNVPVIYTLGQNYPNPFNPTTTINYSIPQSGYISLKVFNLLGEEVATLFEGEQQAGNYNITFNATDLVSGIYVYQLRSENFIETKKLVLVK